MSPHGERACNLSVARAASVFASNSSAVRADLTSARRARPRERFVLLVSLGLVACASGAERATEGSAAVVAFSTSETAA